ncbi:MAG: phosphatase PAP2 family protein [Nocardioidaceae bacterium]
MLGGVLVYFGVRAITQGNTSAAAANADRVIAVEKQAGIYVEDDLQAAVVDSESLSTVANWIYIWGHWPVIVAVLVWLLLRVPDQFLVYRNAMLISGLVGIVIFAAFPVAPPRLLDLGLVDTVAAQSQAYRALQPPAIVNQYAAMPSFHVGWDLLIGIAMVRECRRLWLRVVGCLLPLAMAWSVVVTANHYLLDSIVGSVIVLGALSLAVRLHRGRYLGEPAEENNRRASTSSPSDMSKDVDGSRCTDPASTKTSRRTRASSRLTALRRQGRSAVLTGPTGIDEGAVTGDARSRVPVETSGYQDRLSDSARPPCRGRVCRCGPFVRTGGPGSR